MAEWQDVEYIGVIKEEITSPIGDGSPKSALYEVPIKISYSPPYEWEEAFVHCWNNPPQFTSMHRPGIASVVGSKIILDGTTIEEFKNYHLDTVMLAIQKANERMVAYLQKQEQEKKRKDDQEKRFRDHIDDELNGLDEG